jgi:hypothetical protein
MINGMINLMLNRIHTVRRSNYDDDVFKDLLLTDRTQIEVYL